jgi:hypothetical protein
MKDEGEENEGRYSCWSSTLGLVEVADINGLQRPSPTYAKHCPSDLVAYCALIAYKYSKGSNLYKNIVK